MVIGSTGKYQFAPEEVTETIYCDDCGDEINESDVEEAKDYHKGIFTGYYFCENCKKENLS